MLFIRARHLQRTRLLIVCLVHLHAALVTVCLHSFFFPMCVCIYFISCVYGAPDVRAAEGLFSGILNRSLNGVTMVSDTSTSLQAASSVSPPSPCCSTFNQPGFSPRHVFSPLPPLARFLAGLSFSPSSRVPVRIGVAPPSRAVVRVTLMLLLFFFLTLCCFFSSEQTTGAQSWKGLARVTTRLGDYPHLPRDAR